MPPNLGIPLCCAMLVIGAGGRDGAFEFVELLLLLLLLSEFVIRPDKRGPLLSTVVVFFNIAPN